MKDLFSSFSADDFIRRVPRLKRLAENGYGQEMPFFSAWSEKTVSDYDGREFYRQLYFLGRSGGENIFLTQDDFGWTLEKLPDDRLPRLERLEWSAGKAADPDQWAGILRQLLDDEEDADAF